MHDYLIAFTSTVILSALLTPLVIKIAKRYGIIAQPPEVKAHGDHRPIPYLGGLAIYASFLVSTLVFVPVSRQLIALLAGVTILAVLGAADDVLGATKRAHGIKPTTRLFWQFIASCVVLAGGIGIVTITNPFGGQVDLTIGRFAIDIGSIHFHIAPLANAISILWMMGMVNTMNFLDGLDGLAAGVSSIASLVIFLLAFWIGQPLVALLAVILAASTIGFLPYNFYPAKVFMGDSGAYLLGMTLALIAIYSGGKLATVGLVLGFMIIDALWAVIRRIRRGVSPFSADREHLHHLLVGAGLSQRRAVLALYALAAVFGAVALVSQTIVKIVAMIILVFLVGVLIASLMRFNQSQSEN